MSEVIEVKKGSNLGSVIVKLVIVAVVIALLYLGYKHLPINEWLQTVLDKVDQMGVWGPIVYILVYIVAVVFLIPASLLTLSAGTLFGPVMGTVYVSIASTLGAGAAFIVGRTIARKWVEGKVKDNPKFEALDGAVAREGWKMVGLSRLSPVFPYTLTNYLFGLTKVKFWHYFIASWIGMLPGTALYVLVGSLGRAGAGEGKPPLQWVMLGVGIVATLIVTVFTARMAKRAMNEKN